MKLVLALFILAFSFVSSANSISFMQYNIENFFDTLHDEGTEDWTYLPVSLKKKLPGHQEACQLMTNTYYADECLNLDWTEAKFTKKILNISKMIKSFDNSGKGPDILMLQEVENLNVISKLVSKGLDGLGYQYKVLIEGNDSRGIDVALISKYPVVSSKIHPLVMNGQIEDTRGILQVDLNVKGQTVTVFVNHWPSQGNTTDYRVASAQQLDKLASSLKSDLILAGGDFNTLETEVPYPFSFMSNWVDAEKMARELGVQMIGGTHFYRGEWSSLDHIFIHKKSALKPNYNSFQIMNRSFALKKDSYSSEMIPNRFNFKTAEGFSDHLPMGLLIDIK